MALVVAAVAAALALDARVAAASPSPVPDSTAGTNGDVLAIVQVGTRTYLGGSFSWAGPFTGSGVIVGDSDGRRTGATPRVNGPVRSAVPDGAGGWYIGGEFSFVNGQPRARIAHLLSSGAVTAWNPGADGPVLTLAVGGGRVYAGGSFAAVGGQARSNPAAVDAATAAALGWNPGANNQVRSLAPSSDGSRIFVGGAFTRLGGIARGRIGAVDAVTGAVGNWNPGTVGGVRAVAVGGNRVYVGGNFTSVGGVARTRLAAVDATTGVVDPAFAPAADAEVRALTVTPDGTHLYAVGYFKAIAGVARPGAASLDPNTGAATSFSPSAGGAAIALALSPDATRFYFSTTSNRTYAYAPAAGNTPVWTLRTGGDVQAVAASASEVYVGGHFTTLPVDKVDRLHLASVNAATGTATSWDPRPDGSFGVWALTALPGRCWPAVTSRRSAGRPSRASPASPGRRRRPAGAGTVTGRLVYCPRGTIAAAGRGRRLS